MISHSTTWFDSQNQHTTQEHQSAAKIWGWRIAKAGGASSCSALDCHHSMANTATLTDQIIAHSQQYQHQHQHLHQHQQPRKQKPSLAVSMPAFCDQITSSGAVIDIVILILVLGSCGFLIAPYFTFIFNQMGEVFPGLFMLIGEVIYQAPITYVSGLLIC